MWIILGILVLALLLAIGAYYDKGLWDWLDLLIVPAVIAVGVFLLDLRQRARDQAAQATEQRRQQREMKEQRARELQVEDQRAQDAALHSYLDQMSELLIDKGLHKKADRYHPMRVTARARTLALLGQLNGRRKRTVLVFLREARLINSKARWREGRLAAYACLVGLEDADLKDACLREARLISTDRQEAVSLEGADLERADLVNADLERADLRKVVLKSADLSGADLSEADLSGAVLTNATVTDAQLGTCESLEGATMTDGQILKSDDNPDGPTLEEWLKSKGRTADGENE